MPTPNPELVELGTELQKVVIGDAMARIPEIKMLAHYTSIAALRSILASNEFWFSSAKDMNDIGEVKTGAATMGKLLADHGAGLITTVPINLAQAQAVYAQQSAQLDAGTYILSLSDHGRANEGDRLAMWGLYGHEGDGVCVAFKREAVLGQSASGLFPAKWAPMIYMSPEALLEDGKKLLRQIDAVFANHQTILRTVPSAAIGLMVAICLTTRALAHKHTDFEFEREVRFIHTSPLQLAPLPVGAGVRTVAAPAGPKRAFVLPMRNYPEYGVNAALADLVDHIIVEPSEIRDQKVGEVRALLAAHGLEHIPVKASDSPYRPKKKAV